MNIFLSCGPLLPAFCLVSSLGFGVANAQVNRCIDADGKVEYRSQPCPANAAKSGRITSGGVSKAPEVEVSVAHPEMQAPTVSDAFVFGGRFKPMRGPKLVLARTMPPRELATGAEVISVSGDHSPADVTRVIVHRPGKQVLLVLSSERRMNWKVEPEASTVIRAVLVASGREGPSVVSMQGEVKGFEIDLASADSADSADFRTHIQQLSALLGIERLDVFRGFRELPNRIDIFKPDAPRDDLTLAGVKPYLAGAPLRFQLLGADLRRLGWSNHGTTEQPGAAAPILVNGKTILSPSGKVAYRLDGNALVAFTVGSPSVPVVVAPLPATFPAMSWVMDLAYDSKQDLVTVVSMGGEGFLYRYDVRRAKWLDFRSLNEMDITSLAYDAKASRYVAWSTDGELMFLTGEGVLQSKVPMVALLSDFGTIHDRGNSKVPRLALVPQGGSVVLLHLSGTTASHIWTYDIQGASARLTYKTPKPLPPVAALAPSAGTAPTPFKPVPKPAVSKPAKPLLMGPVKLLDSTPPREMAMGAEVFLVDGEGQRGTENKVIVHRPGKKVLLILSNYDGVKWRIEPEETTTLVGLVVERGRGTNEVLAPVGTVGYAVRMPVAGERTLKALNAMFGIIKLDGHRKMTWPRDSDHMHAETSIYATEPDRQELSLAGVQADPVSESRRFELLDEALKPVAWTNVGPGEGAATNKTDLLVGEVVLSDAGKVVYRLGKNVLQASRREGQPIPVPALPASFPAMSRAKDIAYDVHQNVVAVIAGGHIYRYDARSRTWLDHHDLHHGSASSLTYDPKTRHYLAWTRNGDLIQMDADGRWLSTERLWDQLKDYDATTSDGDLDHRMVMVPRGDTLILLKVRGPSVTHIWTVDLNAWQAKLTYKAAAR